MPVCSVQLLWIFVSILVSLFVVGVVVVAISVLVQQFLFYLLVLCLPDMRFADAISSEDKIDALDADNGSEESVQDMKSEEVCCLVRFGDV